MKNNACYAIQICFTSTVHAGRTTILVIAKLSQAKRISWRAKNNMRGSVNGDLKQIKRTQALRPASLVCMGIGNVITSTYCAFQVEATSPWQRLKTVKLRIPSTHCFMTRRMFTPFPPSRKQRVYNVQTTFLTFKKRCLNILLRTGSFINTSNAITCYILISITVIG